MFSRRTLLAGLGAVPVASALAETKPSSEPLAAHWSLRDVAIRAQARDVGPGLIAVFGDSQIELMRLCDIGGKPALNCGYSGIRTRNLAGRIGPIVQEVRPSLVIIEAGINSVAETVSPKERNAFPADYARLLNGAMKAGAPVYACSILPVERGLKYGEDRPAERIAEFNRVIGRACQEAGATFEDVGAIIRGRDGNAIPGSTVDGIHLTPASYRLFRQRLEQIVAD